MSAWLTVALVAMGLPPILYPVAREWTALTSGDPEALLAAVHRIFNDPSPWWLTAYAVLTQVLLVGFTYFSKSARAKEYDKFWVFVVMCLAAISWLQAFAQWAGL
jgi:hypothetical protein